MEELKPEDLKNVCSCEKFTFTSTSEVQPLINIVGQDRAIRAIETGLNTKADGFNIFITGPTGTGRNTTIKAINKNAGQEFLPGSNTRKLNRNKLLLCHKTRQPRNKSRPSQERRHNQYIAEDKPHNAPVNSGHRHRFVETRNNKDCNTHRRCDHTDIEKLTLDNPEPDRIKTKFQNKRVKDRDRQELNR
jgi:hypothetical protein